MKRIAQIFVIALLAVLLFVSCEQQVINNTPEVKATPAIRGSVSIPKGSGLTGSDFYVRVMEGEKAVYTGKVSTDGSFAVSGLKEDVSYSLLLTTEEPGDIKASEKDISRAGTSGYGGWLSNVSAAVAEDANIGSVKVKPLGTIKGVVTKDGAEDGYDTTVYIPGTSYLAMTDGEGNFSIFNVPQATYTLRFISSGYMAKMVDNVVLFSESDTVNPEITVATQKLIRNVGSIEGFAVRDGETDNSGITLRLEQENSTVNLSATTATNGYFRIDEVPPGTYRVLASYAGYLSQASGYVSVTAANLTSVAEKLELAQNIGTINGSVSLSVSTQKGGINISITGLDSERRYSAVTAEDGTFRRNVSSGRYEVTAFYPGYNGKSTEVSVMQGMSVQVDLGALSSAYGTVSGRIVLEGSVDASGVVVTITDSSDSSRHYSTVTDAQGTYLITGIASAGSYLIECTKDGYLKNNSSSVSVSMGVVSSAGEITMKSLTSKITGSASLEGSEDFTGISILLKAKDNSIQYDATTDQKGSYVMARVNPGEYTLTVSKAGYVSKTVEGIIIESSTEKKLDDVSLLIGSRSVIGSITAELKTDYSGFLVTATNLADENKVYSAITNTIGAYTLAEMVPGEYQIVVSYTGYRTLTLPTVNVVEGTVKTIEPYNIEINRGTIYGKATLEGRMHSAGVKVELLQGAVVYDTQYTDEIGDYSFYVPQGNYSGVRFSFEDFRSESNQDVIALFADNYVRVPDVELIATHNTVRGVVDVFKGVEDVENSNVTLSFDNYSQIIPVVTNEDGAFVFRHVPVSDSKYYLRIQRENCSDIVLQITVQAADEINLGVISMYSNTGTIKGKVILDGEYDSSGILVSVETDNENLTTYTDVTGRYELGGIPAGQVFTVTFSKTGWDTATVQIDPVLEALEVRDMDSLTMIDSLAPVLESIVINSGLNTTTSRNVEIQINASDNGGSGITLMQYSWTDDFSMSEWKNYGPGKTLVIPSEDNGQKTLMLRVRDKFGNMSEIKTDSIELVDQPKVFHGTLSGDDLNWTKAKSPILITDDIYVPSGMTLTIEPGVDVLFNGDYSITIEGYIRAVGTDDERIVFDSSCGFVSEVAGIKEYYGNWGGINCGSNPSIVNMNNGIITHVSGNIISHADMRNMTEGILGCSMIEKSNVQSTGYAIDKFYGSIVDSNLFGEINFHPNNAVLHDYTQFIVGSRFAVQRYGNFLLMVGDRYKIFNDCFQGPYMLQVYNTDFSNCTFDGCWQVSIDNGDATNCEFVNCKESSFFGGNRIVFSNFEKNGADTVLHVSSYTNEGLDVSKDEYILLDQIIDLRFNYWGPAYTNELKNNLESGFKNNTFIEDYYDDDILYIADVSAFEEESWKSAGYKGGEFVAFEAFTPKKAYLPGSDVPISISMLSPGEIRYYRISQSLSGLVDSEWIPYVGECVFSASSVDETLLYNGYLNLFIQCKSDSEEMPIRLLSVGYSTPKFLYCSLRDNCFIADDNVQKTLFVWRTYNYYSGRGISAYLDGESITEDSSRSVFSDDVNTMSYNLEPTSLINGWHEFVFRIRQYDSNGGPIPDSSVDSLIRFYVDRPIPTSNGISILNENATVPEDGSLQLDLSIANAKHLKTLNVKSGESVLYTKGYDDYKANSLNESIAVDCSSLDVGQHYVTIELLDYTGNKTTAATDFFTVE